MSGYTFASASAGRKRHRCHPFSYEHCHNKHSCNPFVIISLVSQENLSVVDSIVAVNQILMLF